MLQIIQRLRIGAVTAVFGLAIVFAACTQPAGAGAGGSAAPANAASAAPGSAAPAAPASGEPTKDGYGY